jgi:hypothetical protein
VVAEEEVAEKEVRSICKAEEAAELEGKEAGEKEVRLISLLGNL